MRRDEKAIEPMDLVWGSENIAPIIGCTPRQVSNMLIRGHLPGAKKIGGRWCISEQALRKLFLEAA